MSHDGQLAPTPATHGVQLARVEWAPRRDSLHISGQRSAIAAALMANEQRRAPVILLRVAKWLCVPAALYFTCASWVPRLFDALDSFERNAGMVLMWILVLVLDRWGSTFEQRWRGHAAMRVAQQLVPELPALEGSVIAANVFVGNFTNVRTTRLRLVSWCAPQLELSVEYSAHLHTTEHRKQVKESYHIGHGHARERKERLVWRKNYVQHLQQDVTVRITAHDASSEPWLTHLVHGAAAETPLRSAFVRHGSSVVAEIAREDSRWAKGADLSEPQVAACRRALSWLRDSALRA